MTPTVEKTTGRQQARTAVDKQTKRCIMIYMDSNNAANDWRKNMQAFIREEHTTEQFFFPVGVEQKPAKGNSKKDGKKMDQEVKAPEVVDQKEPEVNNEVPAGEAPVVQPVHLVANVKKSDKARAIFNEYLAAKAFPARKDIIARFMNECGLTQNGAATYLQNFKTKAGLVAKK